MKLFFSGLLSPHAYSQPHGNVDGHEHTTSRGPPVPSLSFPMLALMGLLWRSRPFS
jgi:hypothetical protein